MVPARRWQRSSTGGSIQEMKLSISLPEEEVRFLDAYARSQGIRSRSGVVQAALRLLRTMELADDYAAAWAEWRADDSGVWDRSSNDGLSD